MMCRFSHFRLEGVPYTAILLMVLMLSAAIGGPSNVEAHMMDELSVKTRIRIGPAFVLFQVELAPGAMIAPVFLELLDADQNRLFDETEVRRLADHVASQMEVRIDGKAHIPVYRESRLGTFEDLITGVGTLYLTYQVRVDADGSNPHALFYRNRLESMIALYSLHIAGSPEQGTRIISEERNEILQDQVSLIFITGQPTGASAYAAKIRIDRPETPRPSLPGVEMVIRRLKNGVFSPNVIGLLVAVAFVVGLLHAFTPGHGKALVGAYLVTNEGSLVQAAALGLVVTVTHTLSIFLFGALSATATYFFLPARVIPVMVLISGVLIICIGLWKLLRRLLGLEVDHAHLLPNLSVLQEESVNVLLDGNAAECTDLLTIASEDDRVLTSLAKAGAMTVNICSPGCDTHRGDFWRRGERQRLQLIKKAEATGAVDIVIAGGKDRRRTIKTRCQTGQVGVFAPPESLKTACEILISAARRFKQRGSVKIPETKFTWKSLATLGFAGGMVPCPDALAILLVSVAMGKLLLGMGIVLSFSIGLSAALVAIGIMMVMSGKALSRSRRFGGIAGMMPYLTSSFILILGVYIVLKILPRVTG